MAGYTVENTPRMQKLAALARRLTTLPMQKQLEVLAASGLTLRDINWENCNDPDMQKLHFVKQS